MKEFPLLIFHAGCLDSIIVMTVYCVLQLIIEYLKRTFGLVRERKKMIKFAYGLDACGDKQVG